MSGKVFYCDSVGKRVILVDDGDWHSTALTLVRQRCPSFHKKLHFEICVRFVKETEIYDDVHRGFTEEICEKVKGRYLDDVKVEFIAIVACVPVELYYFGDGVGGTKEMILPIAGEKYSVAYRAIQSLDEFMDLTVKPALIDYEASTGKHKLTYNGTVKDEVELRFKKNLAIVHVESLLKDLCENQHSVYLRSKHTSYSHTTALIVKDFTYPDIETLVEANTAPTTVLNTLMDPSNVNKTIQNNILRFASSRKKAVEEFYRSHPTESQLPEKLAAWNDCVTKCQDQLMEIKDTTPELFHYNEQLRRQLMDVMIRRVCLMNKWFLLVENKLCVDQEHPPPTFTGTGPVDYTFGGRSLRAITVPVRDISVDEMERFAEENEMSVDIGHVGASKEGKGSSEYREFKASFQALGEGHDLLQVSDCLEVELEFYRNRPPSQLRKAFCCGTGARIQLRHETSRAQLVSCQFRMQDRCCFAQHWSALQGISSPSPLKCCRAALSILRRRLPTTRSSISRCNCYC